MRPRPPPPSYAAAGIAIISPSATNATLTSQGFTTFHRIVPTDGIEGKATADFLAAKYKKVFVVDDSSTYGQGVAKVVARRAQGQGRHGRLAVDRRDS